MINKAILIGNLGRDPEVRHLEGDRCVASLAIATSESYKNKEGERITNTEWHRLELWDGLAKIAEKYLKKGSKVYVEGKLKTDMWEKDGVKHYTTKIRVSVLQMLDSKPQNSEAADGGFINPETGEDDLPF